MDFIAQLTAHLARIEHGLATLVPAATTRPSRLHTAMRYSLEAGGKRLRPVIVLATAELFQTVAASTREPTSVAPHSALRTPHSAFRTPHSAFPDALPAAIALECVHTYSLIHDDLPCMDNDDLRRGRPTAHKQFDDATALLAGDALLTHAFALLAENYAADPALATALVRELADAAGSTRLIGGQMEDLLAEKKSDATAAELEFIHLNKTAAMIEAALVMGGLIGGQRSGRVLDSVRAAGRHLGLAFQIIDDILDATADTATLGKTAGKDAKADKTTFVKLHGLAAARQRADAESAAAIAQFKQLPGDAAFFIALTEQMAARTR